MLAASATDADGFPSLRHVESLLDHLMDQPSSSTGPRTSGAGRYSSPEPSSDDHNSSDDDDEVLSDNLFGDHETLGVREVAVRDVTTRRVCRIPYHKFITLTSLQTQRSQLENSASQGQGPRQPLNNIKVVNWTNGLKRFDYLLQNKKMDWRCHDELHELLIRIDLEKDNITIELLKTTHVGKMIRDLSRCDKFEERSRFLAKRIYRSWLKMCREVEQ